MKPLMKAQAEGPGEDLRAAPLQTYVPVSEPKIHQVMKLAK